MVHYSAHKTQKLKATLGVYKCILPTVHILKYYFITKHFNITLISMLRLLYCPKTSSCQDPIP
jgi:hypothetical protein